MLQKIDIGAKSCLAYKVSGKVTADELKPVSPDMNKAIKDNGRICMMLELNDPKMTLGAFIEDAQMMPKMKDVEKIAVVGESRTEKALTDIANVIGNASRTEVKYFTPDRRNEAIDWVKKSAMKPSKN
jgi:hypothetical protein